MLSMCCCGRHVCPARAVATEACSLQPAARRRYRMHHLLGNDPGRAANQRKWVCRHALEYTKLWRINTQPSLPVIRHANWSETPDSRPEQTRARVERDAFMQTKVEIPTLP